MLCVALINVSCVTGAGAEPFSCSSAGCGKLMLSMSAWRDLEVKFPVISIHDACTLHFSSTRDSSCKLATPLNCLITKCPNVLITFPSFYPPRPISIFFSLYFLQCPTMSSSHPPPPSLWFSHHDLFSSSKPQQTSGLWLTCHRRHDTPAKGEGGGWSDAEEERGEKRGKGKEGVR